MADSCTTKQTDDSKDLSLLPMSPNFGNYITQSHGSKSPDGHLTRAAARITYNMVENMPDSLMSLSRHLLYLSAWQDRCGPALPPILEQFSSSESLQPMVSQAMAALSACRLSRLHPYKDYDSSRQFYFRPALSHQIASQEAYCSAIQGVVSWRPLDGCPDATIILRILLLFCCLESATGNFRGFELHSRGVAKLAESSIESIFAIDKTRGIKLLQAWAEIKIHNWWLRFHFSTPQFLLSEVGFRLESTLRAFLSVAEPGRTSVLSILCESYWLSSVMHMHRWNKADLMGAAAPSRVTKLSLDSLLSDSIARHEQALEDQKQMLSTWHSLVAGTDLPVDSFDDARPPVTHTCSGLNVKPLRFTSHAAAMNYAYYATARIVQTDCGAESVQSSMLAESNNSGDESTLWSLGSQASYWSAPFVVRIQQSAIGYSAGLNSAP
ncbi:hypothetical protein NW760_015247 [Fusarium oxysporum]|nr:hypothetical protein NW769_015061 [Fusarium oxysporum]KAJ4212907.1 hypothetical protein NW760_015247 [Fusarium oxysporum]